MIKNYGLNINEIPDPMAYKLGSVELPRIMLRSDGQWDDFLPKEESQITPSYDTYGCTVYGTENIQQILERFHHGKTSEFDERYNFNLAKIVPPGADPHDVAESFRNDGVVTGQFSIPSTFSEYSTPRPMEQKYIDLGINHPYELRHQWLWTKPQTESSRTSLIKEHLKYSPLAVSVTAWQEQSGVYVDMGRPNTHWTVLHGWNDNGWKIFDSYAPHQKTLSYSHNIEVCKRYQLVPSTRKSRVSILSQIVTLLSRWLDLSKKTPRVEVVSIVAPPQDLPAPVKYSLEIFCAAIQEMEGYYPGSRSFRNKNPGNCKFSAVGYMPVYGNVTKDAGGFAIFPTYDLGWLYLKNLVKTKAQRHPYWTLLEFTSNYAPVTDNNDPRAYAVFIAKKLDADTSLFLMSDLVL